MVWRMNLSTSARISRDANLRAVACCSADRGGVDSFSPNQEWSIWMRRVDSSSTRFRRIGGRQLSLSFDDRKPLEGGGALRTITLNSPATDCRGAYRP
jgi:hypothetical protein